MGHPYKVDEDEVGSFLTYAKKYIKDIKKVPSLVFAPKTNEAQPPYWTGNFSWQNEQYQARVGHKYLSVHILCDKVNKYTSYDASLKPQIEKWLKIYKEAIELPESTFQTEGIIFGYTNDFHLPMKGFDISKYFKINLGIKIDGFDWPAKNIANSYSFFDPKSSTSITTNIEVRPEMGDKSLTVITQVLAERRGISKFHIGQTTNVLDEIKDLKEIAKDVFYGITTDYTKKEIMMGSSDD